ncbi:MAG: hypothetical protein AB1631_34380 [Acidobacteriota bacterium]
MKKTSLIVIAVCLIALAAGLTGWFFRADATTRTPSSERWEYLVVSGGHANLSGSGEYPRMRKQPDGPFSKEAFPLERNLDKLGADGWELVAVAGTPNDPVFYLKRPARAER